MDKIEIKIEKAHTFPIGDTDDVVHFFINGRNLIGLITDIELLAHRTSDEYEKYSGLPAKDILPPSKHLMDEPNPSYLYHGNEDKRMILICLCGVEDCNCILAKVSIGMDTVIWSDFENPTQIEPIDYSMLKFTFDRKEYESELSKREYFETINSYKSPFDYKPVKW